MTSGQPRGDTKEAHDDMSRTPGTAQGRRDAFAVSA